MSFTHYPKLAEGSGLFGSVLWYGPDDPRNTVNEPLAPGGSISIHGSAVNFTRYYGTMFCDQPLGVGFSFSNEELVAVPSERIVKGEHPMLKQLVDVDTRLPEKVRGAFPVNGGLREVTDEDLVDLNYDGNALILMYQPASGDKPAMGDKFLVTIYGSSLRVQVKNVGSKPVSHLRCFVRASVF